MKRREAFTSRAWKMHATRAQLYLCAQDTWQTRTHAHTHTHAHKHNTLVQMQVGVMYLGVAVFGSLLAEIQNVCDDMYHMVRVRARLMLEVRQFLRQQAVPKVSECVH